VAASENGGPTVGPIPREGFDKMMKGIGDMNIRIEELKKQLKVLEQATPPAHPPPAAPVVAAMPPPPPPAPAAPPAYDSLPHGWTEHIDPKTGAPYWHNSATGVTSWYRPK